MITYGFDDIPAAPAAHLTQAFRLDQTTPPA